MNENCSQREFLAHAAIEATKTLGVAGIITDSLTGETVRHLAAFRGPNPILAICYKEKTQRWLNLSFGVIPVHQKEHAPAAYMFTGATSTASWNRVCCCPCDAVCCSVLLAAAGVLLCTPCQ